MKPIIPPPVIGILIAVAMYALAKSVAYEAPAVELRGYLALGLAAIGLLLDGVAVGAFFRARTTISPLTPARAEKLVVEGLYKISRNPMYLGMLLILTAWAIKLGNPVNVIFLVAFVWIINEVQIKPEERALEEKFGDDYLAYKARVRRWI